MLGAVRLMLIVDSQVHIWDADRPERPWPAGRAGQAQKPYPVTKDMVLAAMDEAGVNRAVLVPPSWEGDYNDLVLAAAQQHPDRFGAMGRLSVARPESREQVPRWKRQRGMLGIRLTFHIEEHRKWLFDGTADWIWPAAERAGIPIMVYAPASVRTIETIAARHPGLKLVLDHLALGVHARGHLAFVELADVCRLARLPNVAVKASALPCHSIMAYPFRDLHPHIRRVYDSFGPERMFWGTDWTRLPCSWREAVTLFTEELPWLTDDDKAWIMGRGLSRWLAWDVVTA
jgi:predicted TIM-barrel fold metal-dependent hydrolase